MGVGSTDLQSCFLEQDNAVGVGAFGVVVDAPAIGGLGELLVIDQHQHGFETGRHTAGQNVFFELCLPAMNFANLAMDMLLHGASGLMMSLTEGKYTTVGLNTCIEGKKCVDVDRFYDVEEYRPAIRRVNGLPMFLR